MGCHIMEEFIDEVDPGKIQFRDKWQFELKSGLFPLSHYRNNIIYQEFYFFIPTSLQINEETYSKTAFYHDQTNLIRLKTPAFSFKELIDLDNAESPLVRIQMLSKSNGESEGLILDEIKLLGNIFHSALRNRTSQFIIVLSEIITVDDLQIFCTDFHLFCNEVDQFLKIFNDVKNTLDNLWPIGEIQWTFQYIEEFINLSIEDYFAEFLQALRSKYILTLFHIGLKEVDERICQILLKIKEQPCKKERTSQNSHQNEYFLYRKGLLNKFVIDPLLLKTTRTSFSQRYRNVIGAIPAGVAMLVYLLLLVLWMRPGTGNFLLINSQSLILLTVSLYILKDRIKDELKHLSVRKAAQWFSDYTTQIRSPADDRVLGVMKESFSFIDEAQLSHEIHDIRKRQFHNMLETVKRSEKIIYYKKTVNIKKKSKTLEARFYGLNIIFRFDIHHFLTKTEDPVQTCLILDPKTLKLRKLHLARVYHINVILKNTTTLPDGLQKIEYNKFRLIVDKNGIKRVEEL
jgi:hypothetical protein